MSDKMNTHMHITKLCHLKLYGHEIIRQRGLPIFFPAYSKNLLKQYSCSDNQLLLVCPEVSVTKLFREFALKKINFLGIHKKVLNE